MIVKYINEIDNYKEAFISGGIHIPTTFEQEKSDLSKLTVDDINRFLINFQAAIDLANEATEFSVKEIVLVE